MRRRLALTASASSSSSQFSEDAFRNKTVEFFREQTAAKKPFFAFVSFVTPHSGFCSHEASSHVQPAPYAVPYVEPPYRNLTGWSSMYKDYASAVTRQDRDFGIILDELEKLGIANNTVVISASDNGPEAEVDSFFNSAGPFRGYKRALLEGGMRTPMAVRWPGVIEPGTSSDAMVNFYDILPTVADIAGLSADDLPPGTDGVSFTDTFQGQGAKRKANYWEFCYNAAKPFGYPNGFGQAVRDGDMKMIRSNYNYSHPDSSQVQILLFDLSNDIGELHDLSKDPKYAQTIKDLSAIMDANHVEDVYWPSGPNCCRSQFKAQGPCTPSNPPYPPHQTTAMPPPGFAD